MAKNARGGAVVKRPNPVLALPAWDALSALPQEQRRALAALLRDLGADADTRAEKAWRTRKGPMAAYWRAVGVYARHIARALAPSGGVS